MMHPQIEPNDFIVLLLKLPFDAVDEAKKKTKKRLEKGLEKTKTRKLFDPCVFGIF